MKKMINPMCSLLISSRPCIAIVDQSNLVSQSPWDVHNVHMYLKQLNQVSAEIGDKKTTCDSPG